MPADWDATGHFIQLVTPPGEVQVIVQRVGHESRAHLDIETDSIFRAGFDQAANRWRDD